MGHQRLGSIPRTRQWEQVIALVESGGHVSSVAAASIRAVEQGLAHAWDDVGLRESLWRLACLPLLAQDHICPSGLSRALGIQLSNHRLMGLAAAYVEAVDCALSNNQGRTDLGELAQITGVETLFRALSPGVTSLFDSTPEALKEALAALATPVQFGKLARRYFARLIYRILDYFLSRVLSEKVGEDQRFRTLAEQGAFMDALDIHCDQASIIVEQFCGEWWGKTLHEQGEIPKEEIPSLAHGAKEKLLKELKEGAGTHDP